MSRFFFQKARQVRKRQQWTFRFDNEFFEIQSVERPKRNLSDQPTLRRVKRKIVPDIIDRTAIVYLWNDGFCLFLNMKGNVHELHRDWNPTNNTNEVRFQRQGLNGSKAWPLFSTIRLRVFVKEEKNLVKTVEYEQKKDATTTVDKVRQRSLEEIRVLLKCLLEFFYRNNIRVCFGAISSKDVHDGRFETLQYNQFRSFVQNYSWAMLLSISFRLQVQFYLNEKCVRLLQDYAETKDGETNDDVNDRFYRLSIYLYRRSSEYIFLDLEREIGLRIDELQEKRERFKSGRVKMARFDEATTSTAYIPSVVLTPTTISVRPLKLCKLNRVLREERFGGRYNFALVELRDEAQRLLFASQYRSLKDQIKSYLTDGFHFTPDRPYRYLHHSQSQVKSKQFWFYYAQPGYLSHADAYVWMGNFDKERIVAKHTARIALCFTSSDATIQVSRYTPRSLPL